MPVIGAVGTVGQTQVFINAGHGSMGWTLSGCSGEVLAHTVASALPSISSVASRFSTIPSEELAHFAQHLVPSRFRWPEVFRRAVRMRFGSGGGGSTQRLRAWTQT
mmetsp:Transcript_103976/g.303525  ORF Transcript_103976/g.303525 Transcript_103976/m.303525 type:complete len:106 (+) Transcript_103976:3-320(+)